jgi:hypothetical protein
MSFWRKKEGNKRGEFFVPKLRFVLLEPILKKFAGFLNFFMIQYSEFLTFFSHEKPTPILRESAFFSLSLSLSLSRLAHF